MDVSSESEGVEVPAQTQTRNRFLERLESGPTIVGTEAWAPCCRPQSRGSAPRKRPTCARPRAVVSLHVSFIKAGAELIETNTFGANRRKLAHHFLDDELEHIISAGVKLARGRRETTGQDVFIGASIGPLGEPAASRVRRCSSPRRPPRGGRRAGGPVHARDVSTT